MESIAERAKNISLNLLPAKSKQLYEKEYDSFKDWQKGNGVTVVNEDVMLTYVHELSSSFKPPTLWSKFSMLKATLCVKENLKIEDFSKVIAYLKRNATGYEPKKSKVLSRDEVNKFLTDADDEIYLMIKVALIIGICGACRREELHSLRLSDILEKNNGLFITLSDTKTNRKRVFSVTADGEVINPLNIYHKYLSLRPKLIKHDYLFVCYRNQKCTIQRVGINTFGKMPAMVAKYLKLPNYSMYTGHCFRRTSATLVSDAGAELVTLKRHGGWRSSTVAESYIEDSLEKKRQVCKLIMGERKTSVTSAAATAIPSTSAVSNMTEGRIIFSNDSFKYAENCTFNFNLSK